MIPKIIHSIWLGNKPKPKRIKKCEDSWKKYCYGYDFIEWNEDNFNISKAPLYVKEAYSKKKWAFVSDYIRLWALVNYGGIYLDTDVELLKNLNSFLQLNSFIGFEEENYIGTAIIGAAKNNVFLQEIKRFYEDEKFITPKGLNLTTNVKTVTSFFQKEGLLNNNKKQIIKEFSVFPKDFFAPKNFYTGKLFITQNTHCIHHFNGSWLSPIERLKVEIRRKFNI